MSAPPAKRVCPSKSRRWCFTLYPTIGGESVSAGAEVCQFEPESAIERCAARASQDNLGGTSSSSSSCNHPQAPCVQDAQARASIVSSRCDSRSYSQANEEESTELVEITTASQEDRLERYGYVSGASVSDSSSSDAASRSRGDSSRVVELSREPAGICTSITIQSSKFSPSEEEFAGFLQRCKQVIYYIFQLEKCPSTNKFHYQGYLRLTSPQSFSYVKKLFSTFSSVHIEIAHGTDQQCIAYCSKEESRIFGPWEFGERSQQGKRKDIEVVRELVAGGSGLRDIIDHVSSFQALKCAEFILTHRETKRNWEPDVRWYHGSTGSGKTRAALDEFPDAWISGKNLRWWQGYDAHTAVIIDDFRADFCTFHELLRILDRYPYTIEVKGGSRQLLARTIIITCPYTPTELYSSRSSEDIQQLLRRIKTIQQFGQVVTRSVTVNNRNSVHHFVSDS